LEVGIEAGARIAADIKNRLKDDLALITAGQPLPVRDTGEKPLPLLQPDLEERIKLAAQLAVDAFLMEAAERVRLKAEGKLAEVCPPNLRGKLCQSGAATPVPPDNFAERRPGKKRGAAFKRGGSLLSPPDPDGLLGDTVPAYLQDRRTVLRKRSKLPRFSIVVADYLTLRAMVTPGNMKDVQSASSRISVFLDLIGDHPVDRYEPADLQAFILLMADWPARPSLRNRGSAREVIDEARRLGHRPLAEKSVKDGYVAAVRAAMRSGMTSHSYRDPFHDVSLRYPSSLAPSRQTASLNARQLTTLFRIGTETGHMDAAMLPLLAHLTGRRLSALIYLRGIDIIEKFDNVWVVQPTSIVEIEGRARRVPLKTKASLSFFVLHELFHRIGFIDWAISRGDRFLFPDLMRLADPSKSASQYMQRLFKKAGIVPGCGEVFHSLRADCIDTLRDHDISMRDCKLQVGHSIGTDEHGRYGVKALRGVSALTLASLPMRPDVDYSVFETLDFFQLADNHRRKGVRNVMPREVF
jgi:integrase